VSEKRFDVSSLGEILLRLSVPAGRRLEEAASLDVFPAGAEANVVSALARLGRRCSWVGALPRNAVGRLSTRALRLAGVSLEGVVWQDSGRLGVYYVELADPPRNVQVVYDRAESCAARLRPEDVPWNLLLDCRVLHLTGITPALSSSCHAIAAEAIERARAARVPVSFDVNHRQKLWPEKEAASVLEPLLQGVEILFCSLADAGRLFSVRGAPENVARMLQERTGARHVVVSCGPDGAVASSGGELLREPGMDVRICDRLGAGDALAAGVLHGHLDGDFRRGLGEGVALSALALTQFGDAVVTTPEELQAMVGRLSREDFR
jgi:2-dehydro-3-deoxygluconokinase